MQAKPSPNPSLSSSSSSSFFTIAKKIRKVLCNHFTAIVLAQADGYGAIGSFSVPSPFVNNALRQFPLAETGSEGVKWNMRNQCD